MVRVTKPIVFLQVLLIMVLLLGCNTDRTPDFLEVTFLDYTPPFSEDYTRNLFMPGGHILETAILNSSHIIVGEILERVEHLWDSYYLYEVRVEDAIASIGETLNGETILVLSDGRILREGDRHILFIHLNQSTVMPFDYFTFIDWFLLRIGEDNSVERLRNANYRQYVAPFKDDKYNSLEPLLEYIRNYESKVRDSREHKFSYLGEFIDQVDSAEELFQLAEVVMEVYITETRKSSNPYRVHAEYEIINLYKPGELLFDDLNLPSTVQVGDTILCFLKPSAVPATRIGSIIHQDAPEYESLKNWLEEASQR